MPFEPEESARYGLHYHRIRFFVLRFIQMYSLRRADGAAFLTKYAADVIQLYTGALLNTEVIHHGIPDEFRSSQKGLGSKSFVDKDIQCLYISNSAPYKNQVFVVEAISRLRMKGYTVNLLLVGGGKGKAQKDLEIKIKMLDPDGLFVSQYPFVEHNQLPNIIKMQIYLFLRPLAKVCQ
ncbi:hypothetical protein EKD02_09730 [Chlorobium phaeovibrioides]|uniref:Glycosyltransferase n=1 Tax=Chlorobium phaeovibrioides TaxID=1094 RepID=A0A432AS27_CHLPH|nr:hypothetical protein [Chlorobium phaeovibrioides]RTY34604.1 hypothetical protein EKD02_09730 [Chlorobium phaeovibrioides]